MKLRQLIESFVISNDEFEDYLDRATEQLATEVKSGKNPRNAVHDLSVQFSKQHNNAYAAYTRMSDSLFARLHTLELDSSESPEMGMGDDMGMDPMGMGDELGGDMGENPEMLNDPMGNGMEMDMPAEEEMPMDSEMDDYAAVMDNKPEEVELDEDVPGLGQHPSLKKAGIKHKWYQSSFKRSKTSVVVHDRDYQKAVKALGDEAAVAGGSVMVDGDKDFKESVNLDEVSNAVKDQLGNIDLSIRDWERRWKNKSAGNPNDMKAPQKIKDLKAQKAALMKKHNVSEEIETVEEGWETMKPIDTEKYQERRGLEGPFQTRIGKVVYYDPKEGSYYDPDTDMYMSYEEWKELDGDSPLRNEAEEQFAGWLAFYNGKKLKIRKDQANDLYGAKLKAIKHFNVPKSKQGVLAIKPAYAELNEAKQINEFIPLLAPVAAALAPHIAGAAARAVGGAVVRRGAAALGQRGAQALANRGMTGAARAVSGTVKGAKAANTANKAVQGVKTAANIIGSLGKGASAGATSGGKDYSTLQPSLSKLNNSKYKK